LSLHREVTVKANIPKPWACVRAFADVAWLKACKTTGINDLHFRDRRKPGLTCLALNKATVRKSQLRRPGRIRRNR